jgi:hypothetical protein
VCILYRMPSTNHMAMVYSFLHHGGIAIRNYRKPHWPICRLCWEHTVVRIPGPGILCGVVVFKLGKSTAVSHSIRTSRRRDSDSKDGVVDDLNILPGDS